MSEGINLLDPNKKNENLLPAKRMQFMNYFAIGLLFIVSVSSVTLFILISLSPLPELKRQEQGLRNTLAQSSEDMAKLALLDERTGAIADLLEQRTSYDKTIELLQNKLPSNAAISSIRVDQKTLVVTVESNSLQSLDTFLNGMIGYVQGKEAFSQVTMTSLSTDAETNGYSLTVSMVML